MIKNYPPPQFLAKSNMSHFLASRSAWIGLVLFLLAGIAVLDDYGIGWDEHIQRGFAEENLDYILGNRDAFEERHDTFYGATFDLPLLLVERVLRLEDSRSSYLSRHLLTHLFFLIGGLFCYLLAYRLFNNRLLALLAMLLFLLHPRLYAHSFTNTKDIPFLSMFMIALFLIHRAFDKNTLKAFLWCGAGVAILINLRVMGLMLLAAVIAMRALDWWYATSRKERQHILKTGAVFTLTTVSVLYAVWPYLWENPLGRFMEGITVASDYPMEVPQLFKGEIFISTNLPWDYVPTWFLITTPLVALLLGSVGILATGYRGAIRLGDVFRNTALRFEWLLLACFVLPVIAVIVLNSTLYNGWRHLFFLYAPFCLLAALGLCRLASLFGKKSLRMGVYALAGVGLVATVVEMAQIHPYQNAYFNTLVDRNTPEYLRTQYEMEYWAVRHREGLEYLLEHYPTSPVYVSGNYYHIHRNQEILPEAERQRIITDDDDFHINFHIANIENERELPDTSILRLVYKRKLYNNTILVVEAVNPTLLSESVRVHYLNSYQKITANPPVIHSVFDVHSLDNQLVYVKKPCKPEDLHAHFLVHIFPVDKADLPDWRKTNGFDNLDFGFLNYGARFDDKCMATLSLPEYDIDYIRTGQYDNHGDRGELWSAIWRPQSTDQ